MSIENAAQDHEAKEWEARNAPRATQPTYKPGEAGYGPSECECGADMPPNRRADGRLLCTLCQSAEEHLARRRGGRRH